MADFLIKIIRLYQRYLSGLKRTKCPYYPSCSAYGIEAIKKHGAFHGSLLAMYRILRCNPFSKGGIDPVPEDLPYKKMLPISFLKNRNISKD